MLLRDSDGPDGGRHTQGPGRVQDGGLLEMSDMGNCMSMHQVMIVTHYSAVEPLSLSL